ncbi:hypothetical protein KW795_02995 [Candidatus Microgenomates bacterium]|nr:hypothetical protein [Candidatus Microgenomates bacterium]
MKTIGDSIYEHVKKYEQGELHTKDAIEMLELPDISSSNSAANHYLAALSIIIRLENEIKALRGEK